MLQSAEIFARQRNNGDDTKIRQEAERILHDCEEGLLHDMEEYLWPVEVAMGGCYVAYHSP